MQEFEFHDFHKTRNETVNFFILDYHLAGVIFILYLWYIMLFVGLVMGCCRWVLHLFHRHAHLYLLLFILLWAGFVPWPSFLSCFQAGQIEAGTQWVLLFSPSSGFRDQYSLLEKGGTTERHQKSRIIDFAVNQSKKRKHLFLGLLEQTKE